MELNRIHTNDITQFSTLEEVNVALIGKYLKYKDHNYCINLRGNMCFIHAWDDCEVEVPKHYPFKYTDDDGEHLVDGDTTKFTVKGISQFFFTILT
jgi:hypothetical protein